MTSDNTLRLDGSRPGDHLQMMRTPDLWPHSSPTGAILPLERPREHGEPMDLAFIVNKPGIETTRVFHALIFDGRVKALFGSGDPGTMQSTLYDSHQAIVDDGWVVA